MSKSKLDGNNKFQKILVCGTIQPCGLYVCCNCGQKVYLTDKAILKECIKCNQKFFEKEE